MKSHQNKCNINFITQYAYINNNEYVHINNYKKNNDKITCAHGHELVMCDGQKNKKYFRHKNSEDTGGDPMTEWHIRMQSYFPVTEFILKKINEKQIKERRADALIKEHCCIIEFEHSGKTLERANHSCLIQGVPANEITHILDIWPYHLALKQFLYRS